MTALKRTIKRAKLVEISIVAVPMNPAALIIERSLTGVAMPPEADLNPNPAPAAAPPPAAVPTPAAPAPTNKAAPATPVGELTPAIDPLAKGGVPGVVKKQRQPTFDQVLMQALCFAAGERGIDYGLVREIDSETRRRAPWREFAGAAIPLSLLLKHTPINTLPGGPAESTVGIDWLDALFFDADAAIKLPLIASELGVSTVVVKEETARIPRLTTTIIPAWSARDADLGETDASFASEDFLPKTLGALVDIKRSALLYSLHPAAPQVIPAEMQRAVAIALDQAVLYGAGTLAPDGVITKSTASDPLTDLQSAYLIANDLIAYAKTGAGAKWALPNLAMGLLATTPAWTGAVIPAMQGNVLAGYPAIMNVAAAPGTDPLTQQTYFFGLWEFVSLLIWSSVSLMVNPFGDGWASGSLQARIIVDANVAVRDPKRILRGDATILA